MLSIALWITLATAVMAPTSVLFAQDVSTDGPPRIINGSVHANAITPRAPARLSAPNLARIVIELPPTVAPAQWVRQMQIRASDLDANGVVNELDLALLGRLIGPCPTVRHGCPGDLNADGVVDQMDLINLLETLSARPKAARPPSQPPDRQLDENGIPVGWTIIDGDILVPQSWFQQATFQENLWTDGIVPYFFDPELPPAQRLRMLEAMAHWEAAANVHFISWSAHENYVRIVPSEFNYSAVGMAGGAQELAIRSENIFVMCHELGHALGYWHEQSRTDRDTFVDINDEIVCQDCCSSGPCNYNFMIVESSSHYGIYDFDSVMHYGRCHFSTCESCPGPECYTITVLPPWDKEWQLDIGQRNHLSDFDKLTMSFLYPEPDWVFVDSNTSPFLQFGTFRFPFLNFITGYSAVPVGGTVWIQPGTHLVIDGVLDKPATIRAPLGGVTLEH